MQIMFPNGWLLKLNVSKSLCMLIGSHQRAGGLNLTITFDGAILKQVCSRAETDIRIIQISG